MKKYYLIIIFIISLTRIFAFTYSDPISINIYNYNEYTEIKKIRFQLSMKQDNISTTLDEILINSKKSEYTDEIIILYFKREELNFRKYLGEIYSKDCTGELHWIKLNNIEIQDDIKFEEAKINRLLIKPATGKNLFTLGEDYGNKTIFVKEGDAIFETQTDKNGDFWIHFTKDKDDSPKHRTIIISTEYDEDSQGLAGKKWEVEYYTTGNKNDHLPKSIEAEGELIQITGVPEEFLQKNSVKCIDNKEIPYHWEKDNWKNNNIPTNTSEITIKLLNDMSSPIIIAEKFNINKNIDLSKYFKEFDITGLNLAPSAEITIVQTKDGVKFTTTYADSPQNISLIKEANENDYVVTVNGKKVTVEVYSLKFDQEVSTQTLITVDNLSFHKKIISINNEKRTLLTVESKQKDTFSNVEIILNKVNNNSEDEFSLPTIEELEKIDNNVTGLSGIYWSRDLDQTTGPFSTVYKTYDFDKNEIQTADAEFPNNFMFVDLVKETIEIPESFNNLCISIDDERYQIKESKCTIDARYNDNNLFLTNSENDPQINLGKLSVYDKDRIFKNTVISDSLVVSYLDDKTNKHFCIQNGIQSDIIIEGGSYVFYIIKDAETAEIGDKYSYDLVNGSYSLLEDQISLVNFQNLTKFLGQFPKMEYYYNNIKYKMTNNTFQIKKSDSADHILGKIDKEVIISIPININEDFEFDEWNIMFYSPSGDLIESPDVYYEDNKLNLKGNKLNLYKDEILNYLFVKFGDKKYKIKNNSFYVNPEFSYEFEGLLNNNKYKKNLYFSIGQGSTDIHKLAELKKIYSMYASLKQNDIIIYAQKNKEDTLGIAKIEYKNYKGCVSFDEVSETINVINSITKKKISTKLTFDVGIKYGKKTKINTSYNLNQDSLLVLDKFKGGILDDIALTQNPYYTIEEKYLQGKKMITLEPKITKIEITNLPPELIEKLTLKLDNGLIIKTKSEKTNGVFNNPHPELSNGDIICMNNTMGSYKESRKPQIKFNNNYNLKSLTFKDNYNDNKITDLKLVIVYNDNSEITQTDNRSIYLPGLVNKITVEAEGYKIKEIAMMNQITYPYEIKLEPETYKYDFKFLPTNTILKNDYDLKIQTEDNSCTLNKSMNNVQIVLKNDEEYKDFVTTYAIDNLPDIIPFDKRFPSYLYIIDSGLINNQHFDDFELTIKEYVSRVEDFKKIEIINTIVDNIYSYESKEDFNNCKLASGNQYLTYEQSYYEKLFNEISKFANSKGEEKKGTKVHIFFPNHATILTGLKHFLMNKFTDISSEKTEITIHQVFYNKNDVDQINDLKSIIKGKIIKLEKNYLKEL